MLLRFKHRTHKQYLTQLPKIPQVAEDINFFFTSDHFWKTLLNKISNAVNRICIVTLYLEADEGGYNVLNALYKAKRYRPELDIRIIVDWHRAQRGRIGEVATLSSNVDWYCHIAQENLGIDVPIFGVPVNTREAFGVLHFKGFIIDNYIFYSGASINNMYLNQLNKYRYDRYHLIANNKMANIMFEWIDQYLTNSRGVYRLNNLQFSKITKIKNEVRFLRQQLKNATYNFKTNLNNEQLSVIPLVGLGKSNLLNKTILHLVPSTKERLIFCTPYFNLPKVLVQKIIKLLHNGKKVEIIVGDKTANDFFIPEDQPFNIIGTVPYLYEINLRRFLSHLQHYLSINQLIVRLWKDQSNGYHLKGIWIDNNWTLLTSNNLNLRAWYLDLENAILIYDPHYELALNRERELDLIRTHTIILNNYYDLQSIADYPVRVRKIIGRLRPMYIDRLINKIL